GEQAALFLRDLHIVAVGCGLAGEPGPPGGEVDRDGQHAERQHGRQQVAPEYPAQRTLDPSGPPRAEVHGHREQPERHHEVHAGPLDAAGQAEQHADTDPPPAVAETWAVRVVDPTAGYRFGQAFADLFAVHHHTAEG